MPSRTFHVIALSLVLLVEPAVAAPTTAPAAPADPRDAREWDLNEYLRGTPPHIRDTVNGELERLLAKRHELQRRTRTWKAQIESIEKDALGAARKTPEHVALAAEAKRAEQALEASKRSGTTQQKMDASARYNKLRASIDKIEQDAVRTAAPKVAEMRRWIAEDEAGLARVEESITTARTWRGSLLDALRNGFRLGWPLVPGAQGVLGEVTPVDVVDDATIVVEFKAHERVAAGPAQDGLTRVRVLIHPVRLMVTGIDARPLRVGKPVLLDETFAFAGAHPPRGGDGPTYVVRRTPHDVDRLFELIHAVREPQ